MDRRLSFLPHIERVSIKAEKAVAALARITPNIGGPGENKRRVLQTTADGIMLYIRSSNLGRLFKISNVQPKAA